MSGESEFVRDLAVLMSAAGLVAVVFSRLGWPKVIGYIIAGVVLGSHTFGGSMLARPSSIGTIGQLGVVFLMFAMGLSFSARDMRRIRVVALPAAVLDTAVMIWLGYIAGTRVFGWTPAASLFLGVAICDSATTLLAKVLDEIGWSSRPFAKYVLGTSVCEDIVCVGMIAVATGFAQSGAVSAGSFAASLGHLAVFFLSVLVFGMVFLPRLLRSVDRRQDDEALLLTIVGACFFVSFLAYSFDFSLALGAFLVGLVGSASEVRAKLARLVEPLKSMFAAVFFVSIGLLVDPSALWSHAPAILFVSAVILVGKTVNITLASLAAGTDVKTAVQSGMSLAQTGEFAFMVAVLYASVTGGPGDGSFLAIAIGSSLVTTVLNPLMIRLSDRAGDLVEARLPARARDALATYRAWIAKIFASGGSRAYGEFKAAAIRLCVYAVLMIAVSTGCSLLSRYDYSSLSAFFERNDDMFFFALANVFSLVLLPLVVAAARALGGAVADLLVSEDEPSRWRAALRQIAKFVAVASAVALFFVEWTMINIAITPSRGWTPWIGAAVLAVAGALGWRLFVKAGRRATDRFHEALTAEERLEVLERTRTAASPAVELPRFSLDAASPAVGLTIGALGVRAKTGATIVAAYRDGKLVRNLGPDWELQVGDTIVVLGEPHQVAALKDLFGVTA